MCTKQEVDEALQVLRDNNRVTAVPEIAMDGGTMIPVDGIPRTPEEICEMAERLKKRS